MLTEKITFTDFNGVERTEDFQFNLTTAEIMEMEMSTKGGLVEQINNVVAAQDAPEIIRIFKDLILKSYGKKSPDGRGFIKSQQLREDFASTEAYSQLFMKLATDADAATRFVNGIVPASAMEQANKAVPAPALK